MVEQQVFFKFEDFKKCNTIYIYDFQTIIE